MPEGNCTARVLLVDEDLHHANALKAMAREHGLQTVCVSSREAAQRPEREFPTAGLGIVATPDAPGQIARLRNADPAMQIVAVGESDDIEEALDCIRAGANDYVRGPIDSRALVARLKEHFASCSRREEASRNSIGKAEFGIVGASTAIGEVRSLVARMSGGDVTTLIDGPTGSGKEVIALALHRHSPRAKNPLIALNCAALPDELIEGELFGYERGAFSGATTAYPGKLALADGGTLFLDEIGELSPSGQAKLLRAIEARQCYRLGGRKPHNFNIRVIAATNRDLRTEVGRGNFRSDLYYRIAVARISLTGLRERRADIAPLARHFLSMLRKDQSEPAPTLASDAVQLLESHDWPGNARELRNAMEVALLTAAGRDIIIARDLPSEIGKGLSRASADDRRDCEVAAPSLTPSAISRALKRCDGNKSAAARILGCSRMTLYRYLQADPALAQA